MNSDKEKQTEARTAESDSLGDEIHIEQEKKRRLKFAAVVVLLVFVGGFLLFFDNILNYFTANKSPSVGRVEKESARLPKMSDAQWQSYAAKAKDLLAKGKVNEALDTLLTVLKTNPDIAEAHYLAGTAYLRQGRVQSAYDQLRQASALRKDYYEVQEKLGEIYLLAGDYKAARDISSKLTKGGEYLQDGLLLESEIALAEGKLDQALQKADAALSGAKESVKVKSSSYLADLYMKKGNRAEAERIAGKLDPATLDPEGLLSLAKFYLGAGREEKAVSLFRQALVRWPDSAEVNYNYGQYLFKKARYAEAGNYYAKAMTAMPDVQIIAYQFCQCLLAAGKGPEAKVQIDAMLRKYPENALSLGLKFQYHLLAGERLQAIDTLNRITVLIPYAPRPYIILSSLYWQEGMIPLAEKNALKAMKLGEKTVLPHLVIGDVFFSRGQFKPAQSYYSRVLEVDPNNLVALLQMGDLNLALGQPKKAREYYEKALAGNPRVRSIKTKVAWAKAQSGDIEGALTLNRQYMKEVPNDFQAVSAYTNVLVLAGRLNEAVDTVQTTLKKHPQSWELHFLLGDLLVLKKDFKAGAASYDRALELNPRDVNLALNVGDRYEKNAVDAEIERYYLKILKKLPNNPLVINQLAWFYIERQWAPEKAKPLVESLMSEKSWPELKDTIGWYYYKSGNYATAEGYFQDALRLAADRPETRARLALVLVALKKNQQATAEAQKVLPLLAAGPLRTQLEAYLARQKN